MERYQRDFLNKNTPKTQRDLFTNDQSDGEFDFTDVDEDVDTWGDDEFLRFTTTFAGRYYVRVSPAYPFEDNDYRIGWMNQ